MDRMKHHGIVIRNSGRMNEKHAEIISRLLQ